MVQIIQFALLAFFWFDGGATGTATEEDASLAEAMLNGMDKDKDGFLSKAELIIGNEELAEKELMEKDAKMMGKTFNALDTNKDGKVSLDELASMRTVMEELMKPPSGDGL